MILFAAHHRKMNMAFGMPLSPPKFIDGVTLKFPAKLWRIVNNCKTGSIGWDSTGTTIRIHRKQFESEYLSSSKYFKTKNFPSFVRQLNIYGFRKIPTSSRWQDSGTIFEYRNDFFAKGHPELLPEVRRNTAVRRTLREMRESGANITQNALKFPVVSKPRDYHGTKQAKKKVDESHPLLKTSSSSVYKYTIPPPDNLSKITTVYMNPRVSAVGDMQRMSPTKLQEQVVDILPAMNNSDEEDFGNRHSQYKPGSKTSEVTLNKCVRNPILFLPSRSTHDTSLDLTSSSFSMSSLSQESSDSSSGKHLMFGCPIDKDDFDETFDLPCEDDDILVEECKPDTDNKEGNTCLDVSCAEFDTLTKQVFMSDSLAHLGEEQGYLTPAYFNPETGIVTLMLPTLTPEA